MAQLEPLELVKSVQERLLALLHTIGHLGAVNPMEHRRLERDIGIVEVTRASDAHLLRSILASLDGDIDEAERWTQNAGQLNHPEANQARLFTLANLGFASRGLAHARQSMRAGMADVSPMFGAALAVGAFTTITRIVDETPAASQMLAAIANPSIEVARRGAKALALAGCTEDDLARVLDVAGEVLREWRLLWLDPQPGFIALDGTEGDGGAPGVHVSYRVDVSPTEAAKMESEVANRLAERDFMPIGVSVSFIGSQVERLVA
jgi:hypothetical protein